MTAGIRSVTESPAWKALQAHHQKVREFHLRNLFADDPKRGARMAIEAMGIYLDYSKNRITDETLKLLLQLAEECGLRARIDAMFRGEKINVTENRAVLHVALRAPREASIVVDGENGHIVSPVNNFRFNESPITMLKNVDAMTHDTVRLPTSSNVRARSTSTA